MRSAMECLEEKVVELVNCRDNFAIDPAIADRGAAQAAAAVVLREKLLPMERDLSIERNIEWTDHLRLLSHA